MIILDYRISMAPIQFAALFYRLLSTWFSSTPMDQIIVQHQHTTLENGSPADILTLYSGQVVVLTASALAVYKDASRINDPLGNGLLGIQDIPDGMLWPNTPGTSLVTEYRSGYVGLIHQAVLLITPFHVSLFCTADDALTGQNPICQIALQ